MKNENEKQSTKKLKDEDIVYFWRNPPLPALK